MTAKGSELLKLINQERAKRGLKQLKEEPKLDYAATLFAKDIGQRRACTHTGRNGSTPIDRIRAAGLKPMAWGEIVACGQRSPQEAVRAWINSPGHNAIMFSSKYDYFGDGMINNYWVVDFTK